MATLSPTSLCLLLLVSSLCSQALGDGGGSVLFLDGTAQRYLRDRPEINSLSSSEIASTISVLLGSAPSSLLSVESAAKLNEVLLPNPFEKPSALLVLEVRGTEAAALSKFGGAETLNYKIHDSSNVEIEFSDDDISVLSVDELLDSVASLDKEFADLAHLMGGSYVGSMESLDGHLSFTLTSGSSLKLHVAKQADLKFALSLSSLVRGVKKALEMHKDSSASIDGAPALLKGVFTGIEALNDVSVDAADKGLELLQMTLSNLFALLQKQHRGKFVAVVLFDKQSSNESMSIINVKYPSRVSRLLEGVGEVKVIIPAILLVRTSLAWITGIILLVATLMGVYLLLNMPLTRDTLLYANVKLD